MFARQKCKEYFLDGVSSFIHHQSLPHPHNNLAIQYSSITNKKINKNKKSHGFKCCSAHALIHPCQIVSATEENKQSVEEKKKSHLKHQTFKNAFCASLHQINECQNTTANGNNGNKTAAEIGMS